MSESVNPFDDKASRASLHQPKQVKTSPLHHLMRVRQVISRISRVSQIRS